MLANQASSTPPTTAASSDQVMQDGAGRLWNSLGQAPALQMAWRRLPAFRSDSVTTNALVLTDLATSAGRLYGSSRQPMILDLARRLRCESARCLKIR